MNADTLLPGDYPQTQLFSLITDQILNGFYGNGSLLLNMVTQPIFKFALANDGEFQQAIAMLIEQCDKLIACDNEHAFFLKGLICQYGIGDEVDYQQAIQFYERAIVRSNIWAMNNRAMMYAKALGGPQNIEAATFLYKPAIILGNSEAMYNLALMFKSTGYVKDAINFFKQAIACQHPGAMYELSKIYRIHNGHILKDHWVANSLLEQAITFNYPEAMVDRACAHVCGKGGAIDYVAANGLNERAIKLDNPEAMTSRARAHNYGQGGPVDNLAAIDLLERAMALGEPKAALERALMHQRGMGGPIDLIAAIELYEQALRKPENLGASTRLAAIEIRAIAEPLLMRLWPDLLAGKSFTWHTISALRDYCDPKAVVEKIIAEERGTSLVFLKQLLTNPNHPLRVIIEKSPLNSSIRAIDNLSIFSLVTSFKQATSSNDSALVMLKRHARNVFYTRQVFNSVNRDPRVEEKAVPLPIRQNILPFFHPGSKFDRQVQPTDNQQLEMTDSCPIM